MACPLPKVYRKVMQIYYNSEKSQNEINLQNKPWFLGQWIELIVEVDGLEMDHSAMNASIILTSFLGRSALPVGSFSMALKTLYPETNLPKTV